MVIVGKLMAYLLPFLYYLSTIDTMFKKTPKQTCLAPSNNTSMAAAEKPSTIPMAGRIVFIEKYSPKLMNPSLNPFIMTAWEPPTHRLINWWP